MSRIEAIIAIAIIEIDINGTAIPEHNRPASTVINSLDQSSKLFEVLFIASKLIDQSNGKIIPARIALPNQVYKIKYLLYPFTLKANKFRKQSMLKNIKIESSFKNFFAKQ